MQQIVIASHVPDNGRYLFSVPEGRVLHKDDVVQVQTKHGTALAQCLCDSFTVVDNVLGCLIDRYNARYPLAPVTGVYYSDLWGIPDNKPLPAGKYAMRRRTLTDLDPVDLKKAVSAGRGPKMIQPYDEIDIPLLNGKTITVVCAYASKTLVRFIFKDCYDKHVMNEAATNKGGYFASEGRRHVLEDIYPQLPQEWRDNITPRTLCEVIDGEEKSYTDPLWLPSATDVIGCAEAGNESFWPDEKDSFPLPIFAREYQRVKELSPDDAKYDGSCRWWLRSVHGSDSTSFCLVRYNGTANSNDATISSGFAPGFDF